MSAAPTCPTCGGSGKLLQAMSPGHRVVTFDCARCAGTGAAMWRKPEPRWRDALLRYGRRAHAAEAEVRRLRSENEELERLIADTYGEASP